MSVGAGLRERRQISTLRLHTPRTEAFYNNVRLIRPSAEERERGTILCAAQKLLKEQSY